MSEEPSEFRYSQAPLDEDAFAETDPLTDYPVGTSLMPVSAAADWAGNGDPASINTYRTSVISWQRATFRQTGTPDLSYFQRRVWDESASAWGDWEVEINSGALDSAILAAIVAHVAQGNPHTQYLLSAQIFYSLDAIAESDPLDNYDSGVTWMPVSAGANWGPNTGQAGFVTTENEDWTDGIQTFRAKNGNTYRRVYASSAWGAWGTFTIT